MSSQKNLISEPSEGKLDNVVSFGKDFVPEDPADSFGSLSYESKILKVQELADIYNVDQKKLVRKVDFCVIPPFALLYFLAYFNRSSFGFMQLAGIEQDMEITSLQLYLSYTAFFVPYILFQFFANFLMERIRPHFWISLTLFCFGIVTLGSGFIHNFPGYTFLHFLHGVFQAGAETAIFYILAHYYTAKEAQLRFSAIYLVSCIAGILSNLIAYGAEVNLAGINGWVAWRWAIIAYGTITTFSLIILFFTIPDFPEGARFFNDDETFFLIKKLEIFGGKSGYGLESLKSDLFKSAQDPLIWLPAISSLGIYYATYVYAFHEPQIMDSINKGGVSNISFGLYPWIVAFIWVNLSAYFSLVIEKKYPVIAVNLVIGAIGSLLIVCPGNPYSVARYAGCFLVCAGGYAALPIIMCWSSLNMGGHLRKSMVTLLQISFGSAGGLVALMSFYNQETKARIPFIVCVVLQGLTGMCCLAYYLTCKKMNGLKRTSQYKESFYEKGERERIIFCDKHPNFDYAL